MGAVSAAAEGWEVLRSRVVDDLRVPTSGLHPIHWPAVPTPPALGDIQGILISGILDPLSTSERTAGEARNNGDRRSLTLLSFFVQTLMMMLASLAGVSYASNPQVSR